MQLGEGGCCLMLAPQQPRQEERLACSLEQQQLAPQQQAEGDGLAGQGNAPSQLCQHHRVPGPEHPGDNKTMRVGCCLLPKKVSRYLTPAMKAVALAQGVELCLIEPGKSLHEQGPFDAIIHKLRPNEEWERNLQDYCRAHPHVAVIDRVDGIRTLQNRSTMLTPLQGEGVLIQADQGCVRVQAPQQVEIPEGTSLAAAQQLLAAAGLQPPLLVKPLWTDGREGSHGLAVLHDLAALGRLLEGRVSSELQPPLVVQQFVEHGGVLFKVYVLGGRTVVSTRPSLGNKYLGLAAQQQGVLSLPRISCRSAQSLPSLLDHHQPHQQHAPQLGQEDSSNTCTSNRTSDAGLACPSPRLCSPQVRDGGLRHAHTSSGCAGGEAVTETRHPPAWATAALAGVLRERLGLQLFNFDLICPEQQPQDLPSGPSSATAPPATAQGVSGAATAGGLGSSGAAAPQAEQQQPQSAVSQLYVVDINYFPGIDKIPDFEHVFIDFLRSACEGSLSQQP